MANMMADRLRETEADLKQAREAFDFKCKENEKLKAELKNVRAELASVRQKAESREKVFAEMKKFLIREIMDDETTDYIVDRLFMRRK